MNHLKTLSRDYERIEKAIAKDIGSPRAVRAVGSAIGKNPIAYLIPCHRVIRSMGDFSGYRWGTSRKKAILAKEAASFFLEDFRKTI